MSYDLYCWPVDRALSEREALEEIERILGRWSIGARHDRQLDPFLDAIDQTFPGIRRGRSEVPIELSVQRGCVTLSLPWSSVEELVSEIAPIAFEAGLGVYDPQRQMVALPRPFGSQPLTTIGIEEHEQLAASAMETIVGGFDAGDRSVASAAMAGGMRLTSPLGFEITPEIEAEVQANPLRVPAALQTAERKAELIGALASPEASRQHLALAMLSGWDPDRDVADAVRPLLGSDDVFVVSQAATVISRQGDAADLPALREAVRQLSPAGGGTIDAMLMVLLPALDLAALAGPAALAELKAKARGWAEPPPGSRRSRDGDLIAELDRLLG